MTPCQTHLVTLLETSRESIIRDSTDIAFLSNDNPIARADVEQMIRACVALLEEGLRGDSGDVRTSFLEVLPDVAKTTTWELTLKNGIPCWCVILGRLLGATEVEHRPEALVFLSRFVGQWWSDVSKVMLPVFVAEGTL
jgi:hypothetical protein